MIAIIQYHSLAQGTFISRGNFLLSDLATESSDEHKACVAKSHFKMWYEIKIQFSCCIRTPKQPTCLAKHCAGRGAWICTAWSFQKIWLFCHIRSWPWELSQPQPGRQRWILQHSRDEFGSVPSHSPGTHQRSGQHHTAVYTSAAVGAWGLQGAFTPQNSFHAQLKNN